MVKLANMSARLPIVLLLVSARAIAQDSLLIKAITDGASKNYNRINRWEWKLTRDLVVSDSGPAGTQISYQYDKDSLIRIVCSGFNDLGSWGREYYPVNGELSFVYTTLEYFSDKAPPYTPPNWKNLPTAEYRIYFRKGKLIGAKPGTWKGSVAQLQKEFDTLLKLVK